MADLGSGADNPLNFIPEQMARLQRVAKWNLRWATVTQADPLRVLLDGPDTAPLNFTPDSIVGGLEAGERVLVLQVGTYTVVLGNAGGLGDGSPVVLTTEDLNTVMASGTYVQPINVEATGARHYPSNRAGWLEVVDARGLGSGHVFQTYQEYGGSGDNPRRAWRSWYSGSWSAWQIIEGKHDTGWLTCPLRGNFSYQPGFTLQAKLRDGVVRLRGGLADESIIAASQTYTVADLPDSRFWPVGMTHYQMGAGSTPAVAPEFIVGTAGAIQLRTNTAKSNYYLANGIAWDVT